MAARHHDPRWATDLLRLRRGVRGSCVSVEREDESRKGDEGEGARRHGQSHWSLPPTSSGRFGPEGPIVDEPDALSSGLSAYSVGPSSQDERDNQAAASADRRKW